VSRDTVSRWTGADVAQCDGIEARSAIRSALPPVPVRKDPLSMIFIVVKFPIRPEKADEWETLARQYARDVNSEEGCLFYTWHRTVDDPNEWVCVEGFRDQDAAVAHVNSAAFKNLVEVGPDLVASQPLVINTTIEQNDWGAMGEISPRNA
jgi:quinol monooxygenase YgiN